MSDSTAPTTTAAPSTTTTETLKTVTEQATELVNEGAAAVSNGVAAAVDAAEAGVEAIAEAVTGEKRTIDQLTTDAAEKTEVSSRLSSNETKQSLTSRLSGLL